MPPQQGGCGVGKCLCRCECCTFEGELPCHDGGSTAVLLCLLLDAVHAQQEHGNGAVQLPLAVLKHVVVMLKLLNPLLQLAVGCLKAAALLHQQP